VLAGRIELFRSDPDASDACAKFEQMFGFRQSLNVAKGFCVTANWMSPRRVLQALGGFNGALKSGGDGEMAQRIAAAGHPLVYAPEMVIAHPVRGDLRELLAKRRRVVGGAWARLESPARPLTLFRSTLANGVRKGWEVVRARELAALDRLKLSGIVLLALGVELAEVLRLTGGGKPTRA
jgi:GT2 family glycosyltransferase